MCATGDGDDDPGEDGGVRDSSEAVVSDSDSDTSVGIPRKASGPEGPASGAWSTAPRKRDTEGGQSGMLSRDLRLGMRCRVGYVRTGVGEVDEGESSRDIEPDSCKEWERAS